MIRTTILSGERGGVGSYLAELLRREGERIMPYDPTRTVQADRFLHLAARSGSNWRAIIESNVHYLQEVINYCELNKIPHIIFFSAASIYGQPNEEMITEESSPIRPDLYGVSKLFAEKILECCSLQVLCLRLPAILTRGIQGNLPSRWYQALKSDETVTIYNGEKMFNNYICVENIARFLQAVELKQKFDTINLASRRNFSLQQAVEFLKQALHSKSRIICSQELQPFFSISTEKAVAKYDFEPFAAEQALQTWCEINAHRQ